MQRHPIELPLIPKRMMFFWSDSKLSWLRYLTIYSFRKYNPDWEIVVYYHEGKRQTTKPWNCDIEQDFINYSDMACYKVKLAELGVKMEKWDISEINKPKFIKLASPFKCDLCEWSSLASKGGFYSDFDILYYRSMDKLYDEIVKSRATTIFCSHPQMAIGLMGSIAPNSFYSEVLRNALKFFNKDNYQSAGVVALYETLAPGIIKGDVASNIENTDFIKQFNKRFPSLKLYNIPRYIVYPIWSDLNELFLENIDVYNKFPDSIGLHWYGGNPTVQILNNILKRSNYRHIKNTITTCIERVLDDGY